MTKREAEQKILEHESKTCYLTRYDEAKNCCFLTVKIKENEYEHFAINVTRDQAKSVQYELEGTSKVFDKISDLLHFYENNQVNFKDCIGNPVVFTSKVSFSIIDNFSFNCNNVALASAGRR